MLPGSLDGEYAESEESVQGSADPDGDLGPAPQVSSPSWYNLDEGISVRSQHLCAEETGWRGGRS